MFVEERTDSVPLSLGYWRLCASMIGLHLPFFPWANLNISVPWAEIDCKQMSLNFLCKFGKKNVHVLFFLFGATIIYLLCGLPA